MSPPEDVLQASPLLLGLSAEELQVLLGIAELRTYGAGELIVEEGTASDCLFILRQGAVQVEKGMGAAPVVLAVLQDNGDFFGEMSLIDIMPCSATICAQGDAEIFAFPKKSLTSIFVQFPRVQMTMILNIARNLSLRLRSADERIVELSRLTE